MDEKYLTELLNNVKSGFVDVEKAIEELANAS